jgi:hypothetical protein
VRESVLRESDDEAPLADAAVAYQHALNALSYHSRKSLTLQCLKWIQLNGLIVTKK